MFSILDKLKKEVYFYEIIRINNLMLIYFRYIIHFTIIKK